MCRSIGQSQIGISKQNNFHPKAVKSESRLDKFAKSVTVQISLLQLLTTFRINVVKAAFLIVSEASSGAADDTKQKRCAVVVQLFIPSRTQP